MSTDGWAIVAVSVTSFAGSPDVAPAASPPGLDNLMMLNVGSGVVEYSFDGSTVHGELDSSKPSVGKSFDRRTPTKGIWFRVKSGSTGPISVDVEQWLSR